MSRKPRKRAIMLDYNENNSRLTQIRTKHFCYSNERSKQQ